MNVYDFDGTIYSGDSTIDFYIFELKRNPALIRFCIHQLIGFGLYATKKINKTELKEHFFCFLNGINDIDKEIGLFWEKHHKKIKTWYLEQKEDADVIISASPAFLLEPMCHSIGVKYVIASIVNPSTGMYDGINCYGKEKIIRFLELFGDVQIDNFYSDSYSDEPIAKFALKAHFVKGNKILEW